MAVDVTDCQPTLEPTTYHGNFVSPVALGGWYRSAFDIVSEFSLDII
jgi:hypothetical protein